MMMMLLLSFLLILPFISLVFSQLTLNETFTSLSNWIYDIDGTSGNVTLLPSTSNEVFFNISTCNPLYDCYRAEISITPSLRPTVIPNCSLEYWLGMSAMIPSNWVWSASPSGQTEDLTYNFQLHGGDNTGNSPNLGIRIEDNEITVNICGNVLFNSSSEFCQYYNLGPPTIGGWMDWVVNSKLSYGTADGFVKIWRNGVLMLSVSNLLTAYNDTYPPYIKVGSYQTNWKDGQSTGYDWTAISYSAVRVGTANSNYDEVYTGTGTPCGSPCDTDSSDDYTWSRRTLLLWIIVPMGLIAFFSVVLYIGSNDYKARYSPSPRPTGLSSLVDATASQQGDSYRQHSMSHNNKSHNIFSFTLRYSYGPYLGRDHSATGHNDAHDGNWMTRELGLFRTDSGYRKLFWYGFAVMMTAGMMVFALLLYGRPAKGTPGLLPWTHLDHWTPIQFTLVVITATMMTIYFLPLAYLKHDFNAGERFKNDPKFLRRIGVIIPCHKSAGEIGEVVNRVMKYIPAENIVVCDNGNFEWPPDNTFEVLRNVSAGIRYCYIKQGHKTRALWTGVHRLPAHVDYVIHLDDDTHFSEHMVFDESHFTTNPSTIAIAFLRSSYPLNTVTQFTDFWYKITDHFHATQARICTRCFVPGPAGLWRRQGFIEIFGAHPSLPFGEDIFGGFTTLNSGYHIGVESRCMVKTFAPPILVPWFITGSGRVQGYGASSLWKQRAHRWTVSALRITGKSLYSFFTYDTKTGIATNIAFRLYRFREYKIILVQLLYIPLGLVIIARGFYIEFVIFKLLLFLLPLARNIFINYYCWRGQPQLQVDLRTVLLSPLFNFFLICCAIHGRWKCLLWYLPNVAPNHGMLQRYRPLPLREVKCDYNPLSPLPEEKEEVHEVEEVLQEEEPTDPNEMDYEAERKEDCSQDASVSTDDPYHTAVHPTVNALHADVENNIVQAAKAAARRSQGAGNKAGMYRKSTARKASMAERVLRESPDSFELFEKDGSSRVVSFHTKLVLTPDAP